jgi:hypothetical protein
MPFRRFRGFCCLKWRKRRAFFLLNHREKQRKAELFSSIVCQSCCTGGCHSAEYEGLAANNGETAEISFFLNHREKQRKIDDLLET